MLTIGRAPRRPVGDSPAALLVDCHARIRRHVEIGRLLGATQAPEPEPGQIVEPAAACVRYFTVALPLHAADEELSLRPRLEAAGADAALARALATMAREHGPIDATIAELVPLWEGLTVEPGRRPELRAALDAGAARLADLFAAHLAAEESDIFPMIALRLDPEEQAVLVAEMRARRRAAGARAVTARDQ
jgi:hemerythrin-like domain-containing protein